MQLTIASIGKVKQKFVMEAEAEYIKRLKLFTKIRVEEYEFPKLASLQEQERKKRETEEFLSKRNAGEFLIALDENGKQFTSEEFAGFLDKKMTGGVSSFCFAIGGACGWDLEVMKHGAGLVLSLSSLTFSYQMTRMILVEQIYRAFTIVKGLPYHKT